MMMMMNDGDGDGDGDDDIDIDGRLIFHLQKIPTKIQPDQLYHWLCKEQFNTLNDNLQSSNR